MKKLITKPAGVLTDFYTFLWGGINIWEKIWYLQYLKGGQGVKFLNASYGTIHQRNGKLPYLHTSGKVEGFWVGVGCFGNYTILYHIDTFPLLLI